MKFTYEKLNDFASAARIWAEKNPDESPLLHACNKVKQRVAKAITAIMDPVNEKLEDAQIAHAFVLDKGSYSLDKQGNKRQTPETLQAFINEKRKIFRNHQTEMETKDAENPAGWIDIQPSIVDNVLLPTNLTPSEKEAFIGLII